MAKKVVIRNFKNRLEAELAKGYLEAEGLDVSISTDDAGGMYPQLALMTGGVRLLVDDTDMLKAEALLSKKSDDQ